jgi:flagellar motor switch protein FliM
MDSPEQPPITPPAEPAAPNAPAASAPEPVATARPAIFKPDFRQPSFLSATDLRKLRMRHDDFANALAARLSIHLRMEFVLHITKLQTLSFKRFVESLTSPTHIGLFKLEPLRGIPLVEINPRLGQAIVDRMLGGAGKPDEKTTELSEIEMALLDQALAIVINEWCNQWLHLQDLRPSPLGHENNPRYLQTAPADAVMLVLSMEGRIGDFAEQIQMAFPCGPIEPLIRQISRELNRSESAKASPDSARPKWNEHLNDVALPVTAEWKGFELTARELSRLKAGDILQLDPQAPNQVMVRVGEEPRFRGRLGTRGRHYAIELTEPFRS